MASPTERSNSLQPQLQLWKTLGSIELFSSRWMRLRQDTCELPTKRVVDDYFVMEIPDGAAIAAVTEQDELVLVRQYKHGVDQVVLELPAGIVEPGEEGPAAIARELEEETGYRASSVEYVTTLASKPARLSARTQIYFADKVSQQGTQQENDSEVIQIVLVPLAELPALIQRGEIIVETSLAALLMVWPRLVRS
ncbi:NUDIX hydrolase [Spirosoma sp. KUDC1026]|uniref:NUDIX hydrolase n=1 Tax=Spirosoma sp. KUDC1026 TaxID=2745947 RepID=UPI00159BC4BB|nr:NUDIX hydrolase [Spirosoma sp. KUDC1026]QKZ14336.1 NUDIX hydrolase [Spirosoma sp. KUDC1026]